MVRGRGASAPHFPPPGTHGTVPASAPFLTRTVSGSLLDCFMSQGQRCTRAQGLPASVRDPPGLSHNSPRPPSNAAMRPGDPCKQRRTAWAAVWTARGCSPLGNEFRSRAGSLQRRRHPLRTRTLEGTQGTREGEVRRPGPVCASAASTALPETATARLTDHHRRVALCRVKGASSFAVFVSPQKLKRRQVLQLNGKKESSNVCICQMRHLCCGITFRRAVRAPREAHVLPDACQLLALIPPGASQEPSPHPHHDRLQTGLRARGRQSLELEQLLSCRRQPPGLRSPLCFNAGRGRASPGGHRPAGRHWSRTRTGQRCQAAGALGCS